MMLLIEVTYPYRDCEVFVLNWQVRRDPRKTVHDAVAHPILTWSLDPRSFMSFSLGPFVVEKKARYTVETP